MGKCYPFHLIYRLWKIMRRHINELWTKDTKKQFKGKGRYITNMLKTLNLTSDYLKTHLSPLTC